METVRGFYIIDDMGKLILFHEKKTPGSGNTVHVLFSNFVMASMMFFSELGGGNMSKIILDKSSIYILKSKPLEYHFILKCDVGCEEKEAYAKLEDIEDLTISVIRQDNSDIMNEDILNDLREAIAELIRPKSNIQKFLEIIS